MKKKNESPKKKKEESVPLVTLHVCNVTNGSLHW
jgi:hypothetical protein